MTVTPRIVQWWPTEASSCFEALETYRLVGASACADRITAALVAVGGQSQSLHRDVGADVAEAGRLFCSLKPDTPLYRNLAAPLARAGSNGGATAVRAVAQELSSYRRAAQGAVADYAQAVLEDSETLLVHDYSSTVIAILDKLGAERSHRIVITSGEPLGQGMRVARLAASSGHRVIFAPDMSVARVIGEVDHYVTGVESYYADGSLANTVGTFMLALLCRDTGVSVLAPTETFKYDRECPSAIKAELTARMLHPWPNFVEAENQGFQTVQYVLDAVPAAVVTSFVTEKGVCPPRLVGGVAQEALGRFGQS